MRKTPLSAPDGSYGGKKNYDCNPRRFRHSGSDGLAGYGHQMIQGDNKYGYFVSGNNESSAQKSSDDFIPLGNSSPVINNHRQRNNSGNWRGYGNVQRNHRGTPPSGGGGFNDFYRQNFYHDTPKSSFKESNSLKYFHKHHHHHHHHFGQRRPQQKKDAHRNVDISNYVNVKSMLEDPWLDMTSKLEKSSSINETIKGETMNCTASGSSCGSILIENLNVETYSSNLDTGSPLLQIDVNEKSEITTDAETETS